MAISQTKYVDITSLQEKSSESTRLDGRVYTSSDKLPAGVTMEFDSLEMVGTIFTEGTDEYKFANKYFSYRNLQAKRAKSITFSNFNPTGRKCTLKATSAPVALATLKAITDGSIKIDMGGVATEITGLDFSEVTSYADVATALQTAIRAVTENGELWTGATVTYDATCGFVLQGGTVTASNIGYATDAASGTALADKIKWTAEDLPFVSSGMAVETPVACIRRTMSEANCCGSFAFLDELTTAQIADVAQWNHNQNVRYIYSVAVNASNYSAVQSAVAEYDGVGLTYGDDKFVSYMPMAILAATDYNIQNGTKNYMYTQFEGEIPSVTTNELSNALDNLHINYYGLTQMTGKKISFYQRGYLQGSIPDMGVYANEIWLKQEIENMSMNLFTRRGKLPANSTGVGIFRTALQSILDLAVTNGAFLLGKVLSRSQCARVVEISNSDDAVSQIQSLGYWVNVEVQEAVINSVTEYYLKYILLYAKGDAIRKIEGTDILL